MTSDTRPPAWFSSARFGLFVHWGPSAIIGRGEQVLFREHLDQQGYARMAGDWNPRNFNARDVVRLGKTAGAKYCVFTTRHHDGYCLWNSSLTDYNSFAQAANRDFVQEYVEACREEGLRVGLYYSLADWRIPAYWAGPQQDPQGWREFQTYVHGQVHELLTRYGKIDVIWFDGPWPHGAEAWASTELVEKIRRWQPGILINNRLDAGVQAGGCEQAGASGEFGDFGTPEHQAVSDPDRLWESCQVTTWRLWGYARGEHYRSTEQLLDSLCECVSQGGNLLLNVGLNENGEVPMPAADALRGVGKWMQRHGEAIYGTGKGDLTEFVSYGYQTQRGNTLYLIYRFWPHEKTARVAGLRALTAVRGILLDTGVAIRVENSADGLVLHDLPVDLPGSHFPVIRIEFDDVPEILPWARDRLWTGDPARMIEWAKLRGDSVWRDGRKKAGSASSSTAGHCPADPIVVPRVHADRS